VPSSVSTIPFELERLNEGDAFNLNSGIFTVPVPGIYNLQFSAVKDESASYLKILLQVNGITVGGSWTQPAARGSKNVVSLSISLRLKTGDRVSLMNSGSGAIFDDGFDDGLHLTHFSGWLVEQKYGDEQPSSYQQQKPQEQEQQQGGGLGSISGLVQQGLNIFGSLGR